MWQQIAALRDFNPAYVGLGSKREEQICFKQVGF
jgi:hypothetical protein